MSKPIYVTQPDLPDLDELLPTLRSVWDSKILTNGGPLHQELEASLCSYLGVKHISLFSNGTIALITALQALRITGEVITTPYSFVATAHSLLWNGIRPIFVDIDPNTFNIDPQKVEAAITPQTTAIMPVHCYGNPCAVDALQNIADTYNLRIIYDAAHAFGVRNELGSILQYGDLSVLSFHATKVFNTFEGGAIISPDLKTKRRIDNLKNFGFVDEITVVAPGINGKMSELNAAIGIHQLRRVDAAIGARAELDARYRVELGAIRGITCPEKPRSGQHNYSYFPILVEKEYPLSRDALYELLKKNNIYSRRYFYPLITDFPMYRGLPTASRANLPVAASIADRVLCLPIFPALQHEKLEEICKIIKNAE